MSPDPESPFDDDLFEAARRAGESGADSEIPGGVPSGPPIPPILHSSYAAGPFRRCSICNGSLADGRPYAIQKVYRGTEAVFEMAICLGCGDDVGKEFSEESMESLRRFLTENFRSAAPIGAAAAWAEPRHCHFCGMPHRLSIGFTIVGNCREGALLLPSIVLCDACNEKLNLLLSRKTRDVQDEFIRDNFPGVPADLDLSPSFGGLLI